MAARRLREPVVQMRETLSIAKTVRELELRVELIERLMIGRGMKPPEARRRLSKALVLADGQVLWTFEVAWVIGEKTIYWPHRTEERRFERECLRICRPEFELAWNGRPTRLEHLRDAMEALDHARMEAETALTSGELVA